LCQKKSDFPFHAGPEALFLSHVTTSAVVSTTGLTRSEISPQIQLASNERFQDFLKSYEHEQARAHAEAAQKTTANNSSAPRTSAPDNVTASKPSDAQSVSRSAKSGAQEAVDSAPAHSTASAKQPASVVSASSDTAQKSADTPSMKPSQQVGSKMTWQPPSQPKGGGAAEQSQPSKTQVATEKAGLSENTSELAAASSNAASVKDNPDVVSSPQEASIPSDRLQTVSEPSAASTPDFASVKGAQASAQDDAAPETSSENSIVAEAVNTPKSLNALENASPAQMEMIPDENVSADPCQETSSSVPAESAADAAGNEDHVFRHDEQQPLLYQKTSDGTSTTHIEMNIGTHEKVHVEIGETATKEHRIRINTDNPEVYQSLKDNRETLLATLAQNSAPVTDLQGSVAADIQISLSTPSFLDMSSGGDRQDGNHHQSGSSRNASSVNPDTTDERRILRGVIDLTV